MSKKVKYILIGIGVVLLISIFSSIGSCGSSSEDNSSDNSSPIALTVAQTEVKGDLKGCYEVVDKNYKVKNSDVITVELKRTNKELPYDRNDVVIYPEAKKSSANYCAGFGIEILDVDGDVIEKRNPNSTPYSWDEMTAMLHLTPEDTATLEFHFYGGIPDEAASLRITSLVQPNEMKQSTDNTLDDIESSLEDIINETIDQAYDDVDLKQLKKEAEVVLDLTEKALDLVDMLN